MIELSVIRDLVAIFGVIAGFTYYVLTVRNAQRTRELSLKAQEQALETRQAQLFMEIYNEYRDKEFQRNISSIYNIWEWDGYDDFQEKYGRSTNSDAYSSFASVNSYFEGLGLLVQRGYIDPELVEDLLGGVIIRYWERIRPLTMERRERRDWPELVEWLEYLYDVIKTIRDKKRAELKT